MHLELRGWVYHSGDTRRNIETLHGFEPPTSLSLLSGACGQGWSELPRGELFCHIVMASHDESGILQRPLKRILRSVATDLLFVDHVPKVGPFAHTMNDVLKNPLFPLATVGATEEELVPERVMFSVRRPSIVRRVQYAG